MAISILKIKGIGLHTAEVLKENGYATAEHLVKATTLELSEIPGFGPVRAAKVIASASELIAEQPEPVATEKVKKKKATNKKASDKKKKKKPEKKKKNVKRKDKKEKKDKKKKTEKKKTKKK